MHSFMQHKVDFAFHSFGVDKMSTSEDQDLSNRLTSPAKISGLIPIVEIIKDIFADLITVN